MPITFRAAGAVTTTTTGAAITPAMPTGITATDLALMMVWTSGNVVTTPPVGWQQVATAVGGTTARWTLYARVGSTAASAVTPGGTNAGAAVAAFVAAQAPWAHDAVPVTTTGTTGLATAPAATAAAVGNLLIATMVDERGSGTVTFPATLTTLGQGNPGTTAGILFAWGYRISTATGSQGTQAFTGYTAGARQFVVSSQVFWQGYGNRPRSIGRRR